MAVIPSADEATEPILRRRDRVAKGAAGGSTMINGINSMGVDTKSEGIGASIRASIGYSDVKKISYRPCYCPKCGNPSDINGFFRSIPSFN